MEEKNSLSMTSDRLIIHLYTVMTCGDGDGQGGTKAIVELRWVGGCDSGIADSVRI